jgi:type VI secretion system protein ImpK
MSDSNVPNSQPLDVFTPEGQATAAVSSKADTNITDGTPPDKLTAPAGALYGDRLAQLQRVMAQGRNPFLCAAQVLLRAIADIPQTLVTNSGSSRVATQQDSASNTDDGKVKAKANAESAQIELLRGMFEHEMHTFTQLCDQTNLRRDHMLAVRFALCTAIDEAVGRTSWGGGVGMQTGPWSTKPLLSTFHHETGGGDKVFLLIGRLAASPEEHMNVLEVMLHLLGLGLIGNYGSRDDGPRLLDTIRDRLYTTIASRRDPVPKELSPNWQGVGGGKFKILRSIPVWVTASVAALVVFAAFSWYKYQLVRDTKALEVRIQNLLANKPPAQPARLKTLLTKEIKTGQVSIDESGAMSKVVFRGDDMFVPGKAMLTPKAMALLSIVGKELNEIAGTIVIEGHSDNQPINTPEYPNNLVLSQKRASVVAKTFEANGVPASRLQIRGAGDSKPVANNSTAAGRAKNRRVELLVGADAVMNKNLGKDIDKDIGSLTKEIDKGKSDRSDQSFAPLLSVPIMQPMPANTSNLNTQSTPPALLKPIGSGSSKKAITSPAGPTMKTETVSPTEVVSTAVPPAAAASPVEAPAASSTITTPNQ